MILGIGVDIEEIKRFSKLSIKTDQRLLNKIFTQDELVYCFAKSKPAQHLAVRYAAKEAVIKALQSSSMKKPIYFTNVEIVIKNRVPTIILHGLDQLDIEIFASLTHSQAVSAAFIVITSKQ